MCLDDEFDKLEIDLIAIDQESNGEPMYERVYLFGPAVGSSQHQREVTKG